MELRKSILIAILFCIPVLANESKNEYLQEINDLREIITKQRTQIYSLQKKIKELEKKKIELEKTCALLKSQIPERHEEKKTLPDKTIFIPDDIYNNARFKYLYTKYKHSFIEHDNKYIHIPSLVRTKNKKLTLQLTEPLPYNAENNDYGTIKDAKILQIINSDEMLLHVSFYITVSTSGGTTSMRRRLSPTEGRFLTMAPGTRIGTTLTQVKKSEILHIKGVSTKGMVDNNSWQGDVIVVGTYKYTDIMDADSTVLSVIPIKITPQGLTMEQFAEMLFSSTELPKELDTLKKSLK